MAIQVPRLTWVLECDDFGYPGIAFQFWLNPPIGLIPDGEPKGKEPWETDGDAAFLRNMALVLDRVTFSKQYLVDDDADELVVEIDGARALWELKHDDGFDPQLLMWASARYQDERFERLRVASKN